MIISRSFSFDEQQLFSALSGDYNPIHVDPVEARRLIAGEPVVHGVHTVLWGLDKVIGTLGRPSAIKSIRIVFARAIVIGEEVSLQIEEEADNRVVIRLYNDVEEALTVEVLLEELSGYVPDRLPDTFPEKGVAIELSDSEIVNVEGSIPLFLQRETARSLFPDLMQSLPFSQLAVLLGTTRVVGMFCPGRHSVFSEIRLGADTTSTALFLDYKVFEYDSRFRLASIYVSGGGMAGEISAFYRPVPQCQADYLSLKGKILDDEFCGQRAWVIGGSRGLGELASKMLAFGAADVKLTYCVGKSDAQRVVEDISVHGGIADFLHFDVTKSNDAKLKGLIKEWAPTHLYYFATPFIFSGVKFAFSCDLFEKFCKYYVRGFMNTVSMAPANCHLFYPSTVAIDEMPPDMREYVAAKRAGESLCDYLVQSVGDRIVYKPMLPRLATDQTAGMGYYVNDDPVPVLIRELRAFRSLQHKDH